MFPYLPFVIDVSPIGHILDVTGNYFDALPPPHLKDGLWQMVDREWRTMRTVIGYVSRRVASGSDLRAVPNGKRFLTIAEDILPVREREIIQSASLFLDSWDYYQRVLFLDRDYSDRLVRNLSRKRHQKLREVSRAKILENKRKRLNSSPQPGPSGYQAPAAKDRRDNTKSRTCLNTFETYTISTDLNFIKNLNGFIQNSKEVIYIRIVENKSMEKKGPDGTMVKPPTVFRGKNAIDQFLTKLLDEEKSILDTLRFVKLMVFSMTDEENFKSSTLCSICENPLNGDAVRDHDHLTGAYRGAAHHRCNLNFKLANYIPVVIHNLRNYDGHFLIQGIHANNLYGWAMSQHLPTHDFFWTDEDVNFMNVPDDSEIGYIFEVDLEYPDELHDLHNCYPLAPEKIEITYDPFGRSCHSLCICAVNSPVSRDGCSCLPSASQTCSIGERSGDLAGHGRTSYP
ncbi:uncharacterized protein TNCV_1209631 [Trichonephila clavipes]|nr:uncharacterized protein TNCV_1209631 [Trichonephila clavipes]